MHRHGKPVLGEMSSSSDSFIFLRRTINRRDSSLICGARMRAAFTDIAYATGAARTSHFRRTCTIGSKMIVRNGITRSKAVQAVIEESWPQTQAEFKQMLRDREPALNQEFIVTERAFNEVMQLGELLMAAAFLEQPDVIDGCTTRIVGKLKGGVVVVRMSFGGPFDDRYGISNALARFEAA